jgi:hypothetical protein
MKPMARKIASKSMLKFHRSIRQDTLRLVNKATRDITSAKKREKIKVAAEPVVQKAVEVIDKAIKT